MTRVVAIRTVPVPWNGDIVSDLEEWSVDDRKVEADDTVFAVEGFGYRRFAIGIVGPTSIHNAPTGHGSTIRAQGPYAYLYGLALVISAHPTRRQPAVITVADGDYLVDTDAGYLFQVQRKNGMWRDDPPDLVILAAPPALVDRSELVDQLNVDGPKVPNYGD